MINNNFFGQFFGKIAPGLCRVGMNGKIAVRTEDGYKTYNVKTGRLTNCSNFVMDMGDDMFFVIPTNHVNKGDIILVSGKPHCVIETKPNEIKAFSYTTGTIVNIVPERHMFMGKQYFYGKIVSIFGEFCGGANGAQNIMKYQIMSQLLEGNSNGGESFGIGGNMMKNMMVMSMLTGKEGLLSGIMGNFGEGLFADDDENETNEDESEEGQDE